MLIRAIYKEELPAYVEEAFKEDYDLVDYYDKNVNVKNVDDCIANVIEKINQCYPDADIYGVEEYGCKIGYFVCDNDLLISFGININYRDKDTLEVFWAFIKNTIGQTFQCVLYSHNKRGINFLQKGGMKILFENITILSCNN